jgi:hypothetical protein
MASRASSIPYLLSLFEFAPCHLLCLLSLGRTCRSAPFSLLNRLKSCVCVCMRTKIEALSYVALLPALGEVVFFLSQPGSSPSKDNTQPTPIQHILERSCPPKNGIRGLQNPNRLSVPPVPSLGPLAVGGAATAAKVDAGTGTAPRAYLHTTSTRASTKRATPATATRQCGPQRPVGAASGSERVARCHHTKKTLATEQPPFTKRTCGAHTWSALQLRVEPS